MKILLVIVLLLCACYVLAMRGTKGRAGLEKIRGWSYAHRGLHGNGLPENSMAAFRAAIDAGYGAELDVHLLADGELAVIHDSKLIRTTGAAGRIEDLTSKDLVRYHLEGTDETIPLFTNVLKLFEGKAPLIIEVKVEGNANALCEKVAQVLDGYKGDYCIESFHPQAVRWFRKHRPDVIRGQLAENFFRSEDTGLGNVLQFILSHNLLNFLTRPDFTAYNFRDWDMLTCKICRGLWGIQGVSWTIRSQEDYDSAVAEGWIPIFENFKP